MLRLGYGDHPVVVREIDALAKRVVADRGLACHVMDYSLLTRCHMAQAKVLLCFAEIDAKKQSAAVRSAVKILVKRLVDNEVFMFVPADRPAWTKILESAPRRAELPKGETVKAWTLAQREVFIAARDKAKFEYAAKKGWLKFGFPLHYNSDILKSMYALARHGVPMRPRLRKPLNAVRDKRTPDGRWILENSLNGKMWVDVEKVGKPSKWLTLFGWVVLGHFADGNG